MTEYEHFRVRPLPGSLGAELTNINLNQPLPQPCVQEIQRAWQTHLVLFFHNQSLDENAFMRLANYLGTPSPYPYVEGLRDFPLIVPILKLPEDKDNFGGVWHLDTAYSRAPAKGALLMAVETPPEGGDTLFANMHAAWEALDTTLQNQLLKLKVIHSSDKSEVAKGRSARVNKNQNSTQLAEHPAVRQHPETGKLSLFVSPAHAIGFAGMSEEESEPLLQQLFAHQTREEFCCRFQWQKGSIAIWDNRATLHYPLNDYPGQRRLMYRISLEGEQPSPPS